MTHVSIYFSECSKIFTGEGGQILTPNYPSEYPNNLGCSWVIKVSPESRVKLYFEDFQLEKAAQCFDKLFIKDGPEEIPLGENSYYTYYFSHKFVITEIISKSWG